MRPGPSAPFTWDEKVATFGVFEPPDPTEGTFHAVSLATGEISLLPRAPAGRGLSDGRLLLEAPAIGKDVPIEVVQLPNPERKLVAFGRKATELAQGNSLAYVAVDGRLRVIAAP